jgi:hypothetical protein
MTAPMASSVRICDASSKATRSKWIGESGMCLRRFAAALRMSPTSPPSPSVVRSSTRSRSLQDRDPGALRVDPALQDAASDPAPELFGREARVEEHRDVPVEPRGAKLLLGTGDGEDVVNLLETPPHGGKSRLEILEGDPVDGLRCRQRPLLDACDEDVPRRRDPGERPLEEAAFRDSGCGRLDEVEQSIRRTLTRSSGDLSGVRKP